MQAKLITNSFEGNASEGRSLKERGGERKEVTIFSYRAIKNQDSYSATMEKRKQKKISEGGIRQRAPARKKKTWHHLYNITNMWRMIVRT